MPARSEFRASPDGRDAGQGASRELGKARWPAVFFLGSTHFSPVPFRVLGSTRFACTCTVLTSIFGCQKEMSEMLMDSYSKYRTMAKSVWRLRTTTLRRRRHHPSALCTMRPVPMMHDPPLTSDLRPLTPFPQQIAIPEHSGQVPLHAFPFRSPMRSFAAYARTITPRITAETAAARL